MTKVVSFGVAQELLFWPRLLYMILNSLCCIKKKKKILLSFEALLMLGIFYIDSLLYCLFFYY